MGTIRAPGNSGGVVGSYYTKEGVKGRMMQVLGRVVMGKVGIGRSEEGKKGYMKKRKI